jgi:hypothetical protein
VKAEATSLTSSMRAMTATVFQQTRATVAPRKVQKGTTAAALTVTAVAPNLLAVRSTSRRRYGRASLDGYLRGFGCRRGLMYGVIAALTPQHTSVSMSPFGDMLARTDYFGQATWLFSKLVPMTGNSCSVPSSLTLRQHSSEQNPMCYKV